MTFITYNPISYILSYIAVWLGFIILTLIAVWGLGKWKGNGCLKIIVSNCVAFLVGVTTLVLLMEGYFGFFYDQTDSFGLLLTSQRWHKNHYRFNNLGFRDDKNYYYRKSVGTKRIVFIGDSFTAGHGIRRIEDRFSNKVERHLREISGDYEVYTIAANGWDSPDEIKWLEKSIKNDFDADLIVLCFNMNDLGFDSHSTKLVSQKVRELTPRSQLLHRSFFLNFLYVRLSVLSMPEVRGYYDWLAEDYAGSGWIVEEELLKRFIELCNEKGYKFKVVIFPLIGDLSRGFKMKIAHEKLSTFLAGKGVDYIDLAERFKRFSERELVVNKFDAHPNEFAHSIIAEEILTTLLQDGINKTGYDR